MVYCGKPSKGCQACREKKTRCDRQTPSCSQCIRANRECPGYRSQLDLMFRNESDAVIGKAKAREKSRKPRSAPPEAQSSSVRSIKGKEIDTRGSSPNFDWQPFGAEIVESRSISDAENTSLIPSHFITPTIEERSKAYFSSQSPQWLRTYDLVDSLTSQTSSEEHLIASMSAVGLATFAISIRAPDLLVRARKEYVTALQLTNAALRSPSEVKKDSTLFSVMILSIFETVTGCNERSLGAWTEHINGAAALVKLRGTDQFQNDAGIRMFIQVTSNLMLSCIQRTIAMPIHIIELRKEADRFMDTKNPAWILSGIIIDFTVYQHAVRSEDIVGPREIIEAGLEIDRRFTRLFEKIPPFWWYETIYTDENPHLIWDGKYHVYKEYWLSHLWNGMRTCRILLHEIIQDQLRLASESPIPIFTDQELLVQHEKSIRIMLEMQADILASVPHDTRSDLRGPQGIIEGSRSYFVLWPLYLAGNMALATDELRAWTIARLRAIGESAGINQAIVVADFLTSKKRIEVWEVPIMTKRGILAGVMEGESSGDAGKWASKVTGGESVGELSLED